MRKFIFGGSYSSNLLLDIYPAGVAFSLRKLSSATTSVIRVRRDSDNAELDFTATDIIDGTLTNWTGINNGFIVTVYNQGTSGATYDAVQALLLDQPKIVISGIVETTNFKPTIWFDKNANCAPMSFDAFSTETIFITARVRTANTVNYAIGNDMPVNGVFYNGDDGISVEGIGAFDGSNAGTLTGKDLNQHLAYINMKTSRLYLAKDGSTEIDSGVFSASISPNKLGGRVHGPELWFDGDIQEVILYSGDESANKIAIEADINAYYSIY